MKKKILSIVALVFCIALVLTGCATVSAVQDSNGKPIFFSEAVHFGGNVAQIGDYIYYGNAYVATTNEGFSYNDAAKVAYLARIKNEGSFSFADDVKNVNMAHSSPEGIEIVNGDKLVGYENQDMYALGEYLYFTSANVHKTDELENDYTQVSLFRVKFDGDGFQEIATFANDETGEITLQKGSDGEYYFVAYAPKGDSHAIYSVKVGNSIGAVKTLAEDVTSAVIADKDSNAKTVIYTVDAGKDFKTTSLKAVDFATGDDVLLDAGVAGSTTTLIDRVGDRVFYSYTNPDNKVQEVYSKQINEENTNISPTEKFYNATSISNVQPAYNGYVFKTAGGALVYKTLEGVEKLLLSSSEFTDLLFIDGEYVYTSTTSGIKRVNLIDYSSQTIVSDVTMISGECGYADGYIFFYAKLGELEVDEEDESDEETDENYYMYRTDILGNIQLIGKTAKK